MAKIDENYIEKLVNAVAKMIVEAIENISIEDVNMYQIGYNKAIDEFAEALKKMVEKDLSNPDLILDCKKCGIWKIKDIDEIAEQMKEGAV